MLNKKETLKYFDIELNKTIDQIKDLKSEIEDIKTEDKNIQSILGALDKVSVKRTIGVILILILFLTILLTQTNLVVSLISGVIWSGCTGLAVKDIMTAKKLLKQTGYKQTDRDKLVEMLLYSNVKLFDSMAKLDNLQNNFDNNYKMLTTISRDEIETNNSITNDNFVDDDFAKTFDSYINQPTDYSEIHFDNSIGQEVNYTSDSKKLFKRYTNY